MERSFCLELSVNLWLAIANFFGFLHFCYEGKVLSDDKQLVASNCAVLTRYLQGCVASPLIVSSVPLEHGAQPVSAPPAHALPPAPVPASAAPPSVYVPRTLISDDEVPGGTHSQLVSNENGFL